MNGILTLISALAPLALTELEALAGLSPDNAQLIQGIIGAVQTFIALFKGGATNNVTTSTVLAALEASIQVLQTQTANKVDPQALAITSAFIKAIQAGIAANNSLTIVDPNALQPIQPLT